MEDVMYDDEGRKKGKSWFLHSKQCDLDFGQILNE